MLPLPGRLPRHPGSRGAQAPVRRPPLLDQDRRPGHAPARQRRPHGVRAGPGRDRAVQHHQVLHRGVPREHPHHGQRHHSHEGAHGRQLRSHRLAAQEIPGYAQAAGVKVHEYQAKALLREFGAPVPKGEVADRAADCRSAAERIGGRVVVKAQVHAGGRGKAGGIKVAATPAEAETVGGQILGMRLKTPQTPPEGILVRKVLVEEASAVDRELYLSVTLDRARATHVVMASQAGGMEIEEVAAHSPEKILREWAHPALGLADFQARRLAFGLGLAGEAFKQGVARIKGLLAFYPARDCSLAGSNRLVPPADGRVLALDAKLNFDDNALGRHPELVALRDVAEEDPLDVEASKYGLNYIKLDGNVGCMVNGAGLAMATMDIIKLAGGAPANFLDVGGGASPEQIENAFRILSSDPNVKAVFINVFGGILRCDRLAEGVIAAVRKLGLRLPVVLRAEGTNVEIGKKMLAESGLALTMADDMGEGASKVVALARGAPR